MIIAISNPHSTGRDILSTIDYVNRTQTNKTNMAQQQVVNLPAWFTEVSRFGEKGEYDRALKVVNRSKSLFNDFGILSSAYSTG